jgi:alanine racemase
VVGRQTFATINLKALQHNFSVMSQSAPVSKTIAVIKADAYGHGAQQVAQALAAQVEVFAVAFIDEALLLRDQGITQPILLLEGAMSEDEMACAKLHNFWVMLHRVEHFSWLRALEESLRPVVWIKIDTGMHRLGLTLQSAAQVLGANQDLFLPDSVLCTHLACADELQSPLNLKQAALLRELATTFNLPLSIANSAAITNWQDSHGSWNRLGIALYGCAQPAEVNAGLLPVMSLHAPIIALRNIAVDESVGYAQSWTATRATIIATVAIGYADGYPRHAKTGTPAWLNGQCISLVGRVSMDMLTFDVTDLPQVQVGDSVELWGENMPVETVAKNAATISYELLTCLSPRVKRRYIK